MPQEEHKAAGVGLRVQTAELSGDGGWSALQRKCSIACQFMTLRSERLPFPQTNADPH